MHNQKLYKKCRITKKFYFYYTYFLRKNYFLVNPYHIVFHRFSNVSSRLPMGVGRSKTILRILQIPCLKANTSYFLLEGISLLSYFF